MDSRGTYGVYHKLVQDKFDPASDMFCTMILTIVIVTNRRLISSYHWYVQKYGLTSDIETYSTAFLLHAQLFTRVNVLSADDDTNHFVYEFKVQRVSNAIMGSVFLKPFYGYYDAIVLGMAKLK